MTDIRHQPDDRLRLTRLARGHSQGDLARAAGVTRQAISGIESGRWSPSLDVALALAKVLESTVEELFGVPADAPPVRARLAIQTGRQPTNGAARRLALSEISGSTVAYPLLGDSSFVPGFVPALGVAREDLSPEPHSEGSVGHGIRRHRCADVQALRTAQAFPTLAIGGCDPALALLQGPLQRHDPEVGLVWWPCGNTVALQLLESGVSHIASVHRSLDSRRKHWPGVEVVGFASWREGLAVSPRHSATVRGLEDIASRGLRIANREPGSEARRLLDERLASGSIAPGTIAGYDTECTAHLLVASAIASGLVDAGVTTEPAALTYGLDFVPWQQEISELLIPRSLMGGVEVKAFLDVLAGRELRQQLGALDGYNAESCGRILAA